MDARNIKISIFIAALSSIKKFISSCWVYYQWILYACLFLKTPANQWRQYIKMIVYAMWNFTQCNNITYILVMQCKTLLNVITLPTFCLNNQCWIVWQVWNRKVHLMQDLQWNFDERNPSQLSKPPLLRSSVWNFIQVFKSLNLVIANAPNCNLSLETG